MARIVWTSEALACLKQIRDYIKKSNPDAADRVVTGIYEKVQILKRQPQIGQVYEAISDREVREILYGHYRIAYLLKSENQVEILGIFHSAMNIEEHLN